MKQICWNNQHSLAKSELSVCESGESYIYISIYNFLHIYDVWSLLNLHFSTTYQIYLWLELFLNPIQHTPGLVLLADRLEVVGLGLDEGSGVTRSSSHPTLVTWRKSWVFPKSWRYPKIDGLQW
jgi:hypothetical protein